MVRWPWQTSGAARQLPRSKWVRAVRLVGRGVLAAIMWLLLGAALLAGALLGSGTVRERLLDVGLDVAAKFVPGRLALGQGAWPTLGHLQLTDLVWTDGQAEPDTLAHVAVLELQLDMAALRDRDVRVDSLRVVVSRLDGPAIYEALSLGAAVSDSTPSSVASEPADGPFRLREGAVPGLPSLAVSHWSVVVQAAELTADLSVAKIVGQGSFEAGYGHQAGLVVHHFEGKLRAAVLDSLVGRPLPVSLAHFGLGLRLTAKPDSLAGRRIAVAMLDSLALQLSGMGSVDATGGERTGLYELITSPASLLCSGQFQREGEGYRGALNSDFMLPGAVAFSQQLPEGFPVAGLENVVGRLSLTGLYTKPQFKLNLAVDLSPTPGLGSGQLTVSLSGDLAAVIAEGATAATVVLDTLDFSLLGGSVQARGISQDGEVELVLQAALADSQLVQAFWPGAGDSLRVAASLAAHIQGPLLRPKVTLRVDGGLQSSEIKVPRLSLRWNGSPAGGELVVRLAKGVTAAGVVLDSAATRVTFRRSDGDSLTAAVTAALWHGSDRLALGAHAWADSLGRSARRRVEVDSLVVVARGREMRLTQPAVLMLGPGPLDWELSPVVFGGSGGHITASGMADENEIELKGEVELSWPEALLNSLLPNDLWSQAGGLDFHLAGTTEVSGPRRGPSVAGHLAARLQPHRDEPELGLDLGLALAAGDTSGLRVSLGIVVADTVALRGQMNLPVGLDGSGRWRLDASLPVLVSVPAQTLGLGSLNRLLPPEVHVAGQLSLGAEIRASLAAEDSSSTVAVHLSTAELAVGLPNRSRVTLQADLRLAGSLVEPVLRGRVEVVQGFFRIPELPRSLHPTEGEPLLWDLAAPDTLATLADSLSVFVIPESEGPSLATGSSRVLPEMDLELVVPGNLRIHGYGLDTELAAELKISRGVDEDGGYRPRIQGTARTVDGTLQFMNRVFQVERGEVRFAGAVPPDPFLDMMLETTVNGILVRILVSGSASDPKVELTSEPDLEEEDIVGVLLFGRPLGELDSGQRGGMQSESSAGEQLRQNLAGLAMVFGTAGLQNQMSNTFGVDMVEMGSGSAGDATLMVGKFINPKLMLKYHHSLEKSGTYFLTMEYTLNRIFKLVTTYGQGEEDSGLELKWSRRY